MPQTAPREYRAARNVRVSAEMQSQVVASTEVTHLSERDSVAFLEMLKVEKAGPRLRSAMARRIRFNS